MANRFQRASIILSVLGSSLVWMPSLLAQEIPDESTEVQLTSFRSELVFAFGSHRAARTQTMRLELSSPSTERPAAFVMGDLEAVEGSVVLPSTDVSPTIGSPDNTQTLVLSVTARPSLGTLDAGEYTTTVRIAGEGYETLDVPVTLSFRGGSPFWGVVLALALIGAGLIVGLLFKATESKEKDPKAGANVSSRTKRLAIRLGPRLAGIATGAVVSVIGLQREYLGEATFGAGGFGDWLSLGLWGFAAGFSGKAITDYTTSKTAQ